MPTANQVLCNDPTHQILAREIYKHSAKLLEEQQHAESLLYNISDIVFTVNTELRINTINKAAKDLINLSVEKAEGRTLDAVLTLTDRAGGKVKAEEYCFKPHDVVIQNLTHESAGIRRYLQLQSTTIKSPSREDECIITLMEIQNASPQNPQVICNDSTHQVLAQEIYKRSAELLEEQRHAENLLYNISEAVIAVNKESKINIINKAAEDLINLSTEKAEGKALDEVLILTNKSGSKVESKEYCFRRYDTTLQNLTHESEGVTRYLKLQSTTIKNPRQEEECIITLTDVTQEKILEKSKDEFISIASHELRTPMTIIKSYLWMMTNTKYGDLNPKQQEFLTKAQGGVQRMLNMINDTLNASKIDQGKIQLRVEEIEIREFLKRLIEDFEIKAKEKNLAFKVDVDKDCRVVYSDKGKLEEMLTNLLGNSVKFTSTGGIELRITKKEKSFVKFEITDTGKGIDPADLKRLFHKFGRIDSSYQTVAEAGGTGLGLYIVKNIVENMGGSVGVWSEGVGKGATFWFTLPSEYYEIPQNLRESAILTLAPVLETHVSSICPI